MLQIAKVLKSFGTDGGVLVGLRGIAPEDIDQKEPVYIYFDGLPVPFFIESIEPKGTDKAVVHLCDIGNLEDAEEIAGQAIWAEMELEEDEDEDLTGWTLFDKGTEVGKISGMEPIPGNLLAYVDTGDHEVLIPIHDDFIVSADPDRQEIVLDLPDGLY